ncbi:MULTISPECIES: TIGR04206 family protein [Haloferax]|uniref:TIGR04206 family protein n=1 Tax=Haloferax marinum TaxID=2666143 RepID=A0A6A8G5J2_9EURY|nr:MULTISPECIES: TIGR04206 family protein [Haloferax]KAB1196864.1 TIGR04206 family protein [Haloferax sp. CBA1150]MRW95878.1 TIGR04206 family protein [Haloferax marinum]
MTTDTREDAPQDSAQSTSRFAFSSLTVSNPVRLVLVLVVGVVPWSVQTFSTGATTLLFAWGLLTPSPLSITTITDFFFRYTAGLPDYILVWPVGVVCYVVAVASALSGTIFGREDVRITAAGLALAGVTQLEVARGFSVQPGRTAWPLGTVVLWAVAGFVYWSHKEATSR